MLQNINLTTNRSISIKNFEEDKIATLNAHRGLRYVGKNKYCYKYSGNFYLTNPKGDLIESFEIDIFIGNKYPFTFPRVILLDNKVEKNQDNHISEDGLICFDHEYVINFIADKGLRLYDFANYYLPKYFSWVLVKKFGDSEKLKEWAHGNDGTKQFYENLLGTTDKNIIRLFLESYCKISKMNRNDKCLCGSGKKAKYCHLEQAKYLGATSKTTIMSDISLFT